MEDRQDAKSSKQDHGGGHSTGKPRLARRRRRSTTKMGDQEELVAVAPAIAEPPVCEHQQRVTLAEFDRPEFCANSLTRAVDGKHCRLKPTSEPNLFQSLPYKTRGPTHDHFKECMLRAV